MIFSFRFFSFWSWLERLIKDCSKIPPNSPVSIIETNSLLKIFGYCANASASVPPPSTFFAISSIAAASVGFVVCFARVESALVTGTPAESMAASCRLNREVSVSVTFLPPRFFACLTTFSLMSVTRTPASRSFSIAAPELSATTSPCTLCP